MLTFPRRRPTPPVPVPAIPTALAPDAWDHGGGPAAPVLPDVADSLSEDWSRVWFTLMAHSWRSLALVSASTRHSARPVAERFAECARRYRSAPVPVYDAHDAAPEEFEAYTIAMANALVTHDRVLLVLPSPMARAGAIPLARAADAAVLVVRLGVAGVREARRAVAAVGHAQFLGSVAVRER